jgi:hypothetical protein
MGRESNRAGYATLEGAEITVTEVAGVKKEKAGSRRKNRKSALRGPKSYPRESSLRPDPTIYYEENSSR